MICCVLWVCDFLQKVLLYILSYFYYTIMKQYIIEIKVNINQILAYDF